MISHALLQLHEDLWLHVGQFGNGSLTVSSKAIQQTTFFTGFDVNSFEGPVCLRLRLRWHNRASAPMPVQPGSKRDICHQTF